MTTTTTTARKTIVVTGGAGFIGANLCCHLLSQSPDNYVICVDNLITGNLDNLDDIMGDGNPRFRFIEYDITNPIDPHTIWRGAHRRNLPPRVYRVPREIQKIPDGDPVNVYQRHPACVGLLRIIQL